MTVKAVTYVLNLVSRKRSRAACGDQYGIRVCTVAEGLRHTGRIYPRSSQKSGGGGWRGEERGPYYSFIFRIVPAPSPHWNNFTAQSLVCTCSMSKTVWLKLEGLFLRNPRAFSTEKNPATNKVHYSIKKPGRRKSAKIPSLFSAPSSLRKKYVLYGKSLLYLNQK